MDGLNPYFTKILAEMTPEQKQELRNDPELLAAMQNMTDEQLEALTKDLGGEQNIVDNQMAMAEQLRGREPAQGINAGGQYVAASPLAHIAKTGNNILADYRQNKGIDAMGDISGQRGNTNKTLADILRGAGSQGIMSMFGG